MTAEQIARIESSLNYTFSDKQLLITAFTHSSFANAEFARNGGAHITDNARMSFLGDAILGLIVSKYLYDSVDYSKGKMSYIRSHLVSGGGLSQVVKKLNVTQYLLAASGFVLSDHFCGDLFEAIVCAVYLDGGYDAAAEFVLDKLSGELDLIESEEFKDSKTLLQEFCQSCNPKKSVTYRHMGRSGADNKPTYKCDLFIDEVYVCSGEGPSKKSAEQIAAKECLKKI